MIVGQLPGFIGIEVLLGAQVTVEHSMRADRRIDQQRLEAMAFGKMGCIVAAERAADQQWAAQFCDGFLQLRNRLTRVVMQRRDTQPVGQAEVIHHGYQLAGLVGGRRAVETVDIQDRSRHAGLSVLALKRAVYRDRGGVSTRSSNHLPQFLFSVCSR